MELNRIYCGDSRNMDKIDSGSVHLFITSIPYYVGKTYEAYLPTIDDYYQMLYDVFKEVVRVIIPGGKICINAGDIAVGSRYNGGFPEEIMVLPKLVGYLRTLDTYLYARTVWLKDVPWANSSHVSFHSKIQHAEYRQAPSWEYLFVFRKGKEMRRDKSAADGRWITKDEWKKLVSAQWFIRSVQANKYHEAVFPEELVSNCVKLYSFPGDTVLDSFMGSGTTAVVAKKLGRNYMGYEKEEKYVNLANKRLDAITEDLIIPPIEYFDKTLNKELQDRLC